MQAPAHHVKSHVCVSVRQCVCVCVCLCCAGDMSCNCRCIFSVRMGSHLVSCNQTINQLVRINTPRRQNALEGDRDRRRERERKKQTCTQSLILYCSLFHVCTASFANTLHREKESAREKEREKKKERERESERKQERARECEI